MRLEFEDARISVERSESGDNVIMEVFWPGCEELAVAIVILEEHEAAVLGKVLTETAQGQKASK